jgi:hypothetical protein
MNASQMLAWLLCLALAFFAATLAVRNGLKVALLEKQFEEVRQAALNQQELLGDIRMLLRSIDGNTRPVPAGGPPQAGAAGRQG